MKMKHALLGKKKLHACPLGIRFADRYDTLRDAWEACRRGDWMLWFAARLDVPHKTLMLAKGLCANTVRHLMADERSRRAVDVAIAYGRGRATDDELRAAYADAFAAYADATGYARIGRGRLVAASNAATIHGDVAAYTAAAAARAGASKRENQQQTADICRKVLTRSVFARLKERGKSE